MITLAEQIAEAQRELVLRKKCYPAWVKRGKLDVGDAKYQIRVQEEIVRTLMRLDAEQRQLSHSSAFRGKVPQSSGSPGHGAGMPSGWGIRCPDPRP